LWAPPAPFVFMTNPSRRFTNTSLPLVFFPPTPFWLPPTKPQTPPKKRLFWGVVWGPLGAGCWFFFTSRAATLVCFFSFETISGGGYPQVSFRAVKQPSHVGESPFVWWGDLFVCLLFPWRFQKQGLNSPRFLRPSNQTVYGVFWTFFFFPFLGWGVPPLLCAWGVSLFPRPHPPRSGWPGFLGKKKIFIGSACVFFLVTKPSVNRGPPFFTQPFSVHVPKNKIWGVGVLLTVFGPHTFRGGPKRQSLDGVVLLGILVGGHFRNFYPWSQKAGAVPHPYTKKTPPFFPPQKQKKKKKHFVPELFRPPTTTLFFPRARAGTPFPFLGWPHIWDPPHFFFPFCPKKIFWFILFNFFFSWWFLLALNPPNPWFFWRGGCGCCSFSTYHPILGLFSTLC